MRRFVYRAPREAAVSTNLSPHDGFVDRTLLRRAQGDKATAPGPPATRPRRPRARRHSFARALRPAARRTRGGRAAVPVLPVGEPDGPDGEAGREAARPRRARGDRVDPHPEAAAARAAGIAAWLRSDQVCRRTGSVQCRLGMPGRSAGNRRDASGRDRFWRTSGRAGVRFSRRSHDRARIRRVGRPVRRPRASSESRWPRRTEGWRGRPAPTSRSRSRSSARRLTARPTPGRGAGYRRERVAEVRRPRPWGTGAARGAQTRTQKPPQRGQRGWRGWRASVHSWRQTGSVQRNLGIPTYTYGETRRE